MPWMLFGFMHVIQALLQYLMNQFGGSAKILLENNLCKPMYVAQAKIAVFVIE